MATTAMSAPPLDDNHKFNPSLDLDHDSNMDWNANTIYSTRPAEKLVSRLPVLPASSEMVEQVSPPPQNRGSTHSAVDDEPSSTSSYLEPAPRVLSLETSTRDFAYPPSHYLHHNPSSISEDGSSSHSSPLPSPRRSSSHMRRSSETGESSTMNTGINSGSHWQPGIWGGDGAIYEDMEPLPSTAFRKPLAEEGWNRPQSTTHRKSKSYADVYIYERGRRRDGGSSGSKRGSFLDGAGSDPAGREALRASRGMESESLDEDMYALSMQQSSGRPRRDSHVAQQTLPSRRYHEDHYGATAADSYTISDLPLDHESTTQEDHHTSPQRESLGPEDEELFAGPSLALYDFEPENENELRVREREIIMVSYRHGQGWLVAQNASGDAGLVPEAYVRLLSEMEDWEGVVEEDPEEEGEEEARREGVSVAISGEQVRDVQDPVLDGKRHSAKERDWAMKHPALS